MACHSLNNVDAHASLCRARRRHNGMEAQKAAPAGAGRDFLIWHIQYMQFVCIILGGTLG